MIKEITGDLLTCDANILCHQVNCHGVMGAGIALSIREKLLTEEQYIEYIQFCVKNRIDALGKVLTFKVKGQDQKYVANCFSQNDWSQTGCLTDYDAMRKCFESVERDAAQHGLSVALPGYIGCGIAGGDWNTVHAVILDVFGPSTVQTTVVYWENDNEKSVL